MKEKELQAETNEKQKTSLALEKTTMDLNELKKTNVALHTKFDDNLTELKTE